MKKRTHLIFGFLLFALFNFVLKFPLYLSVFAMIGAVLPDFDWGWGYHRKIFHNLWFLGIILVLGLSLQMIDIDVVYIISIGFISHLILDGITIHGIYPFWPCKALKIKGPMRTGKFCEYMFIFLFMILILALYGIITINVII